MAGNKPIDAAEMVTEYAQEQAQPLGPKTVAELRYWKIQGGEWRGLTLGQFLKKMRLDASPAGAQLLFTIEVMGCILNGPDMLRTAVVLIVAPPDGRTRLPKPFSQTRWLLELTEVVPF